MKNKIIYSIVGLLFGICYGMFLYALIKINLIPTLYLVLGSAVLLLIAGVLLFLIIKLKIVGKIITGVLLIILSIFLLLVSRYVYSTYDFFAKTNNEYESSAYNVLVLKSSAYEKLEDLDNKTIMYVEDENKADIDENLKRISYTYQTASDLLEEFDALVNEEVDAIVLENNQMEMVKEVRENAEDSIKVIYTFTIDKKIENTTSEKDIKNNAFILYISGIDQYGDVNSVKGRSDVNQLLVVNPKTNHIVIVNTPRDYYVQLAGTSGLKDKLTHAGVYGINKSVATLENFYDIDIDYYLRVNFNTVIKLVDVIGGIEIDSDTAFTSSHIPSWQVQKGVNTLDGQKALAYSRERYAYSSGDRHRGENQQQVISAIINKATDSKVLLSKYNEILNTLNGSFQTNMPVSTMTDFIKNELNDMSKFKVESVSVTGSDSRNYTYSMGSNYLLYVMEPDMDSVKLAKNKMNEVLNEV